MITPLFATVSRDRSRDRMIAATLAVQSKGLSGIHMVVWPKRCQLCYTRSAMRVYVDMTGDIKAVASLPKQIAYAAKQTCIIVAQEAQPVIIEDIKATFHVRRSWFDPGNKYGIHVRFTRDRADLSSRIETAADWLEEHEVGGTRSAEELGHHGPDPHLTIPQAARPNIDDIVATKNKAWRILPNFTLVNFDEQGNAKRGSSVRVSGRPQSTKGKRLPKLNTAAFFLNRLGTAIFERLPGDRLKLFYTLARQVHIKKQSTVTDTTIRVVELRFGPIFGEQMDSAMKSAK